MIKNFKSFLNEQNIEAVNESYPAILQSFNKSDKNYFAKAYGITADSEVIEIPKDDIAKKIYANMLYVFVNKSGNAFAWGYDTYVNNIEGGRRAEKFSRKSAAGYADKIYGIKADTEVKQKITDRSNAKFDNSENNKFESRIKNLLESHKEELLKKVTELKDEYININSNLLETLEDRIEKGKVYDENAIFAHYTSEKEALLLKDKQNIILKKIAKIGNIFWTSVNYAAHIANVEGVNKFSNDILNVLKK